jgi:hypothetical protein
MTIEDLHSNASPDDIDPEAHALSDLRAWHHVVRALPHLINADGGDGPIRELATWYERVVEDESCVNGPPIQGLDALVDELALVSVPFDVHAELARARWAIRVAEELVQWRRCLRTEGQESPGLAEATTRLEQLIEAAASQLTPG